MDRGLALEEVQPRREPVDTVDEEDRVNAGCPGQDVPRRHTGAREEAVEEAEAALGEAAEEAAEEVKARGESGAVEMLHLDLADFASIEAFALFGGMSRPSRKACT